MYYLSYLKVSYINIYVGLNVPGQNIQWDETSRDETSTVRNWNGMKCPAPSIIGEGILQYFFSTEFEVRLYRRWRRQIIDSEVTK